MLKIHPHLRVSQEYRKSASPDRPDLRAFDDQVTEGLNP
jgi:hypothetical protein